MNRVVVAVATLLGGLTLAAPRAHAFPTGDQFDMDPLEEDGAGGVAFTGAPRWAGHTCAVCHTGAPGRIGLILQADPVDLFDGGYAPGSVYRLRVVLTNQWAARSAAALGDAVVTGPTRTNVNDFRALLIDAGTAAGVD